ncbi:hypothetical protein QBC36DRAFT_352500 [Triangularia setosa]|uniref:Uncharacterized protein n=1 Tax=Triangularia setosa TaxID=2587417 RepID=A0AAN7A5U4_9PEZI|nr:hypothetical protein QBC36DRAFT_352500 [Podospora setosa]
MSSGFHLTKAIFTLPQTFIFTFFGVTLFFLSGRKVNFTGQEDKGKARMTLSTATRKHTKPNYGQQQYTFTKTFPSLPPSHHARVCHIIVSSSSAQDKPRLYFVEGDMQAEHAEMEKNVALLEEKVDKRIWEALPEKGVVNLDRVREVDGEEFRKLEEREEEEEDDEQEEEGEDGDDEEDDEEDDDLVEIVEGLVESLGVLKRGVEGKADKKKFEDVELSKKKADDTTKPGTLTKIDNVLAGLGNVEIAVEKGRLGKWAEGVWKKKIRELELLVAEKLGEIAHSCDGPEAQASSPAAEAPSSPSLAEFAYPLSSYTARFSCPAQSSYPAQSLYASQPPYPPPSYPAQSAYRVDSYSYRPPGAGNGYENQYPVFAPEYYDGKSTAFMGWHMCIRPRFQDTERDLAHIPAAFIQGQAASLGADAFSQGFDKPSAAVANPSFPPPPKDWPHSSRFGNDDWFSSEPCSYQRPLREEAVFRDDDAGASRYEEEEESCEEEEDYDGSENVEWGSEPDGFTDGEVRELERSIEKTEAENEARAKGCSAKCSAMRPAIWRGDHALGRIYKLAGVSIDETVDNTTDMTTTGSRQRLLKRNPHCGLGYWQVQAPRIINHIGANAKLTDSFGTAGAGQVGKSLELEKGGLAKETADDDQEDDTLLQMCTSCSTAIARLFCVCQGQSLCHAYCPREREPFYWILGGVISKVRGTGGEICPYGHYCWMAVIRRTLRSVRAIVEKWETGLPCWLITTALHRAAKHELATLDSSTDCHRQLSLVMDRYLTLRLKCKVEEEQKRRDMSNRETVYEVLLRILDIVITSNNQHRGWDDLSLCIVKGITKELDVSYGNDKDFPDSLVIRKLLNVTVEMHWNPGEPYAASGFLMWRLQKLQNIEKGRGELLGIQWFI